jgi:hyperosmotically inducible protein
MKNLKQLTPLLLTSALSVAGAQDYKPITKFPAQTFNGDVLQSRVDQDVDQGARDYRAEHVQYVDSTTYDNGQRYAANDERYHHGTNEHLGHYQVLGPTQRASELIGMTVQNNAGEKLGKVEDLVVDVNSGRVVDVVVSSGGFLGIGSDFSVVPPRAFRIDRDQKIAFTDTTKDQWAAAPHFKNDQWPTMDADYTARSYTAFGYQPYFEADSTGRNVRDREGQNLTPIDQGTSTADLDTTRRIRREIMRDTTLSSNARNVKIITVNGHVTLRGPVDDDAQKASVEAIAKRISPDSVVDNQLDVKSSTNR